MFDSRNLTHRKGVVVFNHAIWFYLSGRLEFSPGLSENALKAWRMEV
jgi:hypothetical protein